jgi:serine/threonine protein phosphatase 1
MSTQRTFTIGDVHGCLVQLDALLESIKFLAEDHVVMLGDYVDRGPDSKGVMERVIRLQNQCQLIALMGNHEEMMLAARGDADKHRDWLKNGGDMTLRSYGGARGTLKDVPPEHWTFLETQLVPYFEMETHFFVHANAYADMALDEQPEFMLRWERLWDNWNGARPHESGKIMVCGHTPQKDGRVKNVGFTVCIDTCAHGGGNLTCLEVVSGRVWQADAHGKVTRSHLSDFE